MKPDATFREDYQALTGGTGYTALNDHFLIELTGADRKSFLHNYCTADIKALPDGQCCQAFVLNPKGKILLFVHVVALADALWMLAANRDDAPVLIEHLDKYLIRDDVRISDLSSHKQMDFVPESTRSHELFSTDGATKRCFTRSLGGADASIARLEIAGWGWLVVSDVADSDLIERWWADHGMRPCSAASLASLRVQQQTPWSGSEANPDHLPQELQRDDLAISFRKGCYLGQETVARLDALGRVNQLLVGLDFGDAQPVVGSELIVDNKPVGRVTSIARSPQSNGWIGLGFVRRAHASEDSQLLCSGLIATVVAKPV